MLKTTGSGASKDLQDVSIVTAVNYRVNGKKATDLFRNVGTKYEENIVAPAIQESIKSISALYTAEELIIKRQEVSSKMQEKLQSKVEKYGLIIDNFNVINFNFSQAFNQAIEEKQVAEQKVATAKNELERKKIEAEQKIVEAEASAKANQLMEQSLTDGILTQRFIEKWDGKLPVVSGNQNIMDISSLIK
jgi:prohibitin 2